MEIRTDYWNVYGINTRVQWPNEDVGESLIIVYVFVFTCRNDNVSIAYLLNHLVGLYSVW